MTPEPPRLPQHDPRAEWIADGCASWPGAVRWLRTGVEDSSRTADDRP